jgi:hypothetical protein
MYLIVILVVSISYVKALVILFASSKERKLVPKCQLSTKNNCIVALQQEH